MNGVYLSRFDIGRIGGGLLAGLLFVGAALADDMCGLCDKEIVTNSDLATCFLDKYDEFAAEGKSAIVVDLSGCEETRGVVEALAAPGVKTQEPDVKFMLSRAQLSCLKRKLEEPGLTLDPSVTIELESCG